MLVDGNAVGKSLQVKVYGKGTFCHHKRELENKLYGIRVSQHAKPMSNLLYTNDCLMFYRANVREAKAFTCFYKYCNWSRLRASNDKFYSFFSKGTPLNVKHKVQTITSFKNLKAKSVYLRNSFIFGHDKLKEFEKIKEQV